MKQEPEQFVGSLDDEIIRCALCKKLMWFCDSYSPGDDAICGECDTEVTGRGHQPTLPLFKFTAEPWDISKLGTPDYAPQFGICPGDGPNALALVIGDNTAANARLIAKSPQMFRLLFSIAQLLDDTSKYSDEWELKEEALALIKEVLYE